MINKQGMYEKMWKKMKCHQINVKDLMLLWPKKIITLFILFFVFSIDATNVNNSRLVDILSGK